MVSWIARSSDRWTDGQMDRWIDGGLFFREVVCLGAVLGGMWSSRCRSLEKGLRAASVLSGLGEGRASGWMLMIMLAWQARMVQGV